MTSTHLERATRWGARIWAAGSLLLLSAFIFGGQEQSGNGPTATEWIGLAFFPIGIIVGLLAAFWKELPGGGITVLSLAGFYAWHFVVSGQLSCGPWFALFAAPGFLFLLAGLVGRVSKSWNCNRGLTHPGSPGSMHAMGPVAVDR